MQVKVYEMSEDPNNHKLVGQSELVECFPDDPHEMARATMFLNTSGEYVAGGGAALLILLVKV